MRRTRSPAAARTRGQVDHVHHLGYSLARPFMLNHASPQMDLPDMSRRHEMFRLILPFAILCTGLATTTANAGFFNFDAVGVPQGPTASTAFGGYGCCGHVPSHCDQLWTDFCSQAAAGHHAWGGCNTHGLRGCRAGCGHRSTRASTGCAHGGCANHGCANGRRAHGGCASGGCASGGCASGGCAHGGCASGTAAPAPAALLDEPDAPPMPPAEVPSASHRLWLPGTQR
jgi:hypothetical protein